MATFAEDVTLTTTYAYDKDGFNKALNVSSNLPTITLDGTGYPEVRVQSCVKTLRQGSCRVSAPS
jgi:hypothetical protein